MRIRSSASDAAWSSIAAPSDGRAAPEGRSSTIPPVAGRAVRTRRSIARSNGSEVISMLSRASPVARRGVHDVAWRASLEADQHVVERREQATALEREQGEEPFVDPVPVARELERRRQHRRRTAHQVGPRRSRPAQGGRAVPDAQGRDEVRGAGGEVRGFELPDRHRPSDPGDPHMVDGTGSVRHHLVEDAARFGPEGPNASSCGHRPWGSASVIEIQSLSRARWWWRRKPSRASAGWASAARVTDWCGSRVPGAAKYRHSAKWSSRSRASILRAICSHSWSVASGVSTPTQRARARSASRARLRRWPRLARPAGLHDPRGDVVVGGDAHQH